VLVLEGAKEAGKKILMSGGSRCNVLPATIDVGRDYFTAQTATSAARGGRRATATSHKALQRYAPPPLFPLAGWLCHLFINK
jgi:predicted flavoprotein YhiN